MGFRITLAGIDITTHCLESSIQIQDTLGQGPGVAAGGAGRAKTLDILTNLGPASAAVGAGSVVTTPKLVRQGEIKVYDGTGTCIYGGYVTILDDKDKITASGVTKLWTNIEAHDYWQDLDRINVVNETFDGQTDIFIIDFLLNKYAPTVGRSFLSGVSPYQLGPFNFRNKTLQKCLQNIADTVGNSMWIDPNKQFHYDAPGQFATAPFSLAQSPNFLTSFQMGFDEYTVDDTGAINRVTFYGGKRLSNDFVQDLSIQANGSNTTLTLAYYPHKDSTGKFPAHVGGVLINTGFYGSSGVTNTLRSQGGTADVLLNTDGRTLIFDVAPSNTGPNSVTVQYRFETPLVVQLSDQTSVVFYGRELDGTISDETVFDVQTAVHRCRTLLNEQSLGLTTLKVRCWKPGIQSGMLLTVVHPTRGINETFLVQEVDVAPQGGGNFEYQITAGAWHWNLVDFVMTTAANAATPDDTTTEDTTFADVRQQFDTVSIHDAWTTQTRTMSNYLLRTAAVGDGQDAFFGLFSF